MNCLSTSTVSSAINCCAVLLACLLSLATCEIQAQQRPRFGTPLKTLPTPAGGFEKPGLRLPGNGQSVPSSLLKREDAELNDVLFLTPEKGFAVGDRGLILRTTDGGRHWQPVYSGVDVSLQSIQFIDANQGWVAGGGSMPYTHRSTGVVLMTRDGGETWRQVNKQEIPALKKIRFFNGRNGWAIGDATATHRTGILRTRDGGVTWVAIPGPGSPQWTTAAFLHFDQGIVAGRGGLLANVSRTGARASSAPPFGLRQPRDMTMATARDGWLVGDGGMILRTANAGMTWSTAAGLPEGVDQEFDFKAIAVAGNHVWIAGSPGSCVLHSADAGRTWNLRPTGITTPIRAITFIDENNGWAVGALGVMLSTRDGGRTWSVRRSGGTRAALLAISGLQQNESLPFEVLAKYCEADGYLGVMHCVGGTLPGSAAAQNDETCLESRVHAATLAAGGSRGSLSWAFPAPNAAASARKAEDLWNRIHRGKGAAALEEELVRSIRQWRPPVVVLGESGATQPANGPANSLADLVNKIATSAVEKAADPAHYPGQIKVAGLSPWKTKKLYAATVDGKRGVQISAVALLPGLGKSTGEFATAARGFLEDQPSPGGSSFGLELISSRIAASSGGTSLFAGVPLRAGDGARRRSSAATLKSIEAMHLTAQKKRNIRQLLIRRGDQGLQNAWLSRLRSSIDQLPPEEAAPMLASYAAAAASRGEVQNAVDAYESLLMKHATHPLSDIAAQWLVRHYTSGENMWRLRDTTRRASAVSLKDSPKETRVGHAEKIAAAASQSAVPTFGAPVVANQGIVDKTNYNNKRQALLSQGAAAYAAGIEQLNREHLAGAASQADFEMRDDGIDGSWRPRGAAFVSTIQRTHPGVAMQPSARFALAAMTRAGSTSTMAIRPYHRQLQAGGDTRWLTHAANEASLIEPDAENSPSVWNCAKATKRPYLDGNLDDEIWQAPQPIALTGAVDPYRRWPTSVQSAYDGEYLYLAIRCRKAPQLAYTPSYGGRPRDADLSKQDRVTILLDIDRDYSSSYALTVDHRGWSNEVCNGDKTWNPKWHVASQSTGDQWTVEIAIPWKELTGQTPTTGVHWAAAAVRTVPGEGSQAWKGVATSRLHLATFGLFKFQ